MKFMGGFALLVFKKNVGAECIKLWEPIHRRKANGAVKPEG
jgi:hypothetical protein